MKIGIVINSLQAGGAERSALRLSRGLASKHEVTLITLHDDRDFYNLGKLKRLNLGDLFDHSDKRIYLPNKHFRSAIKWILKLREVRTLILKQQFDVLIVFESLVGVIVSLALLEAGLPIVVSERINPDPKVYNPHILSRVFRPWIYARGVVCTVQTKGFSDWIQSNWKIQALLTPNHLEEDEFLKNEPSNRKKKFLFLGRYADQKGFDILLPAWKKFEEIHKDYVLEIYGAGNRNFYEAMGANLNLRNCYFNGAHESVSELMDESICLISTSHFEGFPNVILESLARGLPVIATKSSDIVEDLAIHGKLLMIPDFTSDGLYQTLIEFLRENWFENSFEICQNSARDFVWQKVESNWMAAIEQAIAKKGLRFFRSRH